VTDDDAVKQALHESRQAADPEHDRGGCWCCCFDCPDLDPDRFVNQDYPDDAYEYELNTYGHRIVKANCFTGEHVAPAPDAQYQECTCGWTPWGSLTFANHLRGMAQRAR
jgi:hypothetical protein